VLPPPPPPLPPRAVWAWGHHRAVTSRACGRGSARGNGPGSFPPSAGPRQQPARCPRTAAAGGVLVLEVVAVVLGLRRTRRQSSSRAWTSARRPSRARWWGCWRRCGTSGHCSTRNYEEGGRREEEAEAFRQVDEQQQEKEETDGRRQSTRSSLIEGCFPGGKLKAESTVRCSMPGRPWLLLPAMAAAVAATEYKAVAARQWSTRCRLVLPVTPWTLCRSSSARQALGARRGDAPATSRQSGLFGTSPDNNKKLKRTRTQCHLQNVPANAT